MKKITSAVLGLSLTLAAAGMSFAQKTTPPATSKMDSTSTTTPVKKHKKAKTAKAAKTNVPAAPATPPSK